MSRQLFSGIVVVVLVGGAAGWYLYLHKSQIEIALEERGLHLPFVEDTRPVRVTNPKANAIIKSPLTIIGEAKGTWFFEASFPVALLDATGKEIARYHAEAKSDWMTTDYVPFTAELAFTKPATAVGTLVLEKDNPSGLPEYDAKIEIPVRFDVGTAVSPPSTTKCVVSGCSGQVCANESMVTTCEYRALYACYKTAKCETQSNGECGWTQTSELTSCIGAAQ